MSGPSAWVWRFLELTFGLVVATLMLRWAVELLQPYTWLLILAFAGFVGTRVRMWRNQRW